MKTFRIKQNFGKGIVGFLYFDVEEGSTREQIRKKAYDTQFEDYEGRICGWFGGKATESPTIRVEEYSIETQKTVKEGLKFSLKWR